MKKQDYERATEILKDLEFIEKAIDKIQKALTEIRKDNMDICEIGFHYHRLPDEDSNKQVIYGKYSLPSLDCLDRSFVQQVTEKWTEDILMAMKERLTSIQRELEAL